MTSRIPAEVRAALPVARRAIESPASSYGLADAVVGALHAAGMLRLPSTDQPVPYELTERATEAETAGAL